MKRSGPPERRTPLKNRSAGLKRTRMKRSKVERDWSPALAKVARERKCRACGRTRAKLEAAHVIGREHDKQRVEGGPLVVEADAIVPLCSAFDGDCHGKYDRRELDLWPYITAAEWVHAASLVGEGSAKRRITGRH